MKQQTYSFAPVFRCLSLIILIALVSCTKFEDVHPNGEISQLSGKGTPKSGFSKGEIIFGKQLENPYTSLFIDLQDWSNQSTSLIPVSLLDLPADLCPGDPYFDGANCYVGTPPAGTSAFIYGENFYYTPVNCCDCPYPGSYFDGANCFVQNITTEQIGFIYLNNWYLTKMGDDRYPYDEISGYTIAQLEAEILPDAFGLTSLRTAFNNHHPQGISSKHINMYLDFYFNL